MKYVVKMGELFVSLSSTNHDEIAAQPNSHICRAGKPHVLNSAALLMAATNLTFKLQRLKFVVFFSRPLGLLGNWKTIFFNGKSLQNMFLSCEGRRITLSLLSVWMTFQSLARRKKFCWTSFTISDAFEVGCAWLHFLLPLEGFLLKGDCVSLLHCTSEADSGEVSFLAKASGGLRLFSVQFSSEDGISENDKVGLSLLSSRGLRVCATSAGKSYLLVM